MRLASPALNRAVLYTLAYTPVERGSPVSDTWASLLADLSDAEAEELPQSIGLVLRLLARDEDRLRLVTDMCVTFDLYEVAPYLLELLEAGQDGSVALAAAALAAHPGVPRQMGARIARTGVAEDLPPTRRKALDLRLDPSTTPESELDHLLRLQRWPGIDETRYQNAPIAPVVAVAEEGIPAMARWRLLLALHQRGAAIRRIPRRWEQPPHEAWLAHPVPIVATSPEVVKRLRSEGQQVDGSQFVPFDPEGPQKRTIQQAVDYVSSLLPVLGVDGLRREASFQAAPVERDVLHESVFRLGAYTAAEMAYLSGGARSFVYRWARRLDELRPRSIQGNSYWRFDQLVGLRAYRYLRSFAKRIDPEVIRGLVQLSGRPEGADVLVARSGAVNVVESAGEVRDLLSGQGVIPDVVRVEDTFLSFRLGGHRSVPDLLEPSEHTAVAPQVLGGTPSIRGHRIPCKSLVRLEMAHGEDGVRDAYPELDEPAMIDGIRVGRQILSRR